jgi:hypothetical protein
MDNNINNLLINSNYKILNIKNENKILYDIIFQFCEDNNILVYNINLNISNIQNTSYKLNDLNTDFIFILFSNAPKTHAIDLVDIIYKKYSKYVFYTLSLHYKEIVISIDNNRTIYFNLLFAPDIKYNSKFNIIEYNNLEIYNKKIFLLSNEIILLFITHELYKPSIFINLINDNILMEYKKSNISKIPINELTFIEKYLIILKKLFNKIKTSSNINIINRTKYNIISTFINEINKLEISKSIILLDNIAIDILSNENINYNNTLNIIIQNNSTSNNFNNIQYLLDILKDILKKANINYDKVAYNKSNIYIYNDFRLKKTNIFMLTKDKKKISLINVFNSTDYELIPIIQNYNNFKIPHEFVIIRFILLNLLSSQLYDQHFNIKTYNTYINNISKLYNLDIKYEKIFYTGIFRDEKLDKFKLGSNVVRPLQQELKITNEN